MRNIENVVAYLEERIENMTSQADRLRMGLARVRTNGRPENVCTDEHPVSFLQFFVRY